MFHAVTRYIVLYYIDLLGGMFSRDELLKTWVARNHLTKRTFVFALRASYVTICLAISASKVLLPHGDGKRRATICTQLVLSIAGTCLSRGWKSHGSVSPCVCHGLSTIRGTRPRTYLRPESLPHLRTYSEF